LSRILVESERCKSCGICIDACPKRALAMSKEINGSGYRIVDLDAEKCIQCGICCYVCPDCALEREA
jgi:2-oxoglutarate ferredoxin oxidoreductase subunit delta